MANRFTCKVKTALGHSAGRHQVTGFLLKPSIVLLLEKL
jgi:hypothetical protein